MNVITLIILGLSIMTQQETLRPLSVTLAEADKSFKARQYDEALKLYQEVLSQAKRTGDTSYEIESLSQIARCYLTQNQKDQAKTWLAQAQGVASPNYAAGWARFLGVKGRWEWRNNDSPTAATTFKLMFEYATEHQLAERAMDAALMIGITGNDSERIEWGLKGIKEAESTNSPGFLPMLWNNLAGTYSDIKDYDKAYDAYLKARTYHWLYSDETSKLYADYQVGWILRMKGDLDSALTWLRPALSWAERIQNYDVMGQASLDIGEITITRGDKQQGLAFLQRALDYYGKAGYPENNPEIYEKLRQRIIELTI